MFVKYIVRPWANSGEAVSKRRLESGQTTVEYVLLLAISVIVFVTLFVKLLSPMLTTAYQNVSGNITNMFSGGNLHQLMLSH